MTDSDQATCFTVSEGYRHRPPRDAGLLEVDGWRIKAYGIAARGPGPELDVIKKDAAPYLDAALPRPAEASGRAGVGFVILHQGRGMDYVVLAWWDRENELPIRIWVREHTSDSWRPAEGAESLCVWDLQVVTHERNAYVAHVLSRPDAPDLAGYLAARTVAV